MISGPADGSSEGAAHYRIPLTTRHAPPRRLLVNVGATPLRDSHAAVVGSIVIVEDISTRVQLEEQLQISEKMASIGLLAAGVAHEVNTPLTGISSFTQMLLENAQPDDPSTQVLEKIERQTFRAAKIVNGLLNLARPAQVDSGPCDINVVINDVLSLLEHQFKNGSIQVRKELAPIAPSGPGDRAQAAAGLPEPVPERARRDAEGRLAHDRHPRGSRRRDVVEIADTGSGIPAEQLSRIYDPFFTTKEIGKGTGLGLSITYGIVQEHGGTITCDSHVGQGTRFSIRLPLAAADEDRADVVSREALPRHMLMHTASILVIDDEEIMREILETLLTREGYQVRLAVDRGGGARARALDAVRRGDRRRDDAGHGRRHRARRDPEDRRRPAGPDDHGVRVGRERDRRDEARRLRLHHQAVQERRGAGRPAQRAGAAPAGRREPRAPPEPAGARQPLRRDHRQAARGCARCST